MVEVFAWVTLGFAIMAAATFLMNQSVFRKAPPLSQSNDLPAISVLIPVRNEAGTISQTLRAVLDNRVDDLEVIVLDDQSEDNTAQLVSEVAAADPRLRLIQGASLPRGWCGKQFACHQLAQHAKNEELLFIDADVKLAPDAIGRCLLQRRMTGVDLLSGFPRQQLGSRGEAVLIPLMHIVLLTYLPFLLMRWTNMRSASAGCGQLFLTSRKAYEEAGGHAAIKRSLHDGITLPRAYRCAKLTTDIFDASDLACCRMYNGWSQTWAGLLKNAHEGIANARLILPATSLMLMNYVVPTILLIYLLFRPASTQVLALACGAVAISFVPRIVAAARFDGSWVTVAIFPVSILLFVTLQWVACGRHLLGSPSTWRGRAYSSEVA